MAISPSQVTFQFHKRRFVRESRGERLDRLFSSTLGKGPIMLPGDLTGQLDGEIRSR